MHPRPWRALKVSIRINWHYIMLNTLKNPLEIFELFKTNKCFYNNTCAIIKLSPVKFSLSWCNITRFLSIHYLLKDEIISKFHKPRQNVIIEYEASFPKTGPRVRKFLVEADPVFLLSKETFLSTFLWLFYNIPIFLKKNWPLNVPKHRMICNITITIYLKYWAVCLIVY